MSHLYCLYRQLIVENKQTLEKKLQDKSNEDYNQSALKHLSKSHRLNSE